MDETPQDTDAPPAVDDALTDREGQAEIDAPEAGEADTAVETQAPEAALVGSRSEADTIAAPRIDEDCAAPDGDGAGEQGPAIRAGLPEGSLTGNGEIPGAPPLGDDPAAGSDGSDMDEATT